METGRQVARGLEVVIEPDAKVMHLGLIVDHDRLHLGIVLEIALIGVKHLAFQPLQKPIEFIVCLQGEMIVRRKTVLIQRVIGEGWHFINAATRANGNTSSFIDVAGMLKHHRVNVASAFAAFAAIGCVKCFCTPFSWKKESSM